MPPRYGLLLLPAPTSGKVVVRYAPLADRDVFDPLAWSFAPLTRSTDTSGWWLFDLDARQLADGAYEYEFVLDGDAAHPVADPYADELTRFGGYRGVFHIAGGMRIRPEFRWDDAIEAGVKLPQNNKIVIYEMPLKWMASASDNHLVDLGTFDKVLFEHLDGLQALGVNCIELLPIQDTPQTLNWGYGTRFFYAPDLDMGTPVDAKFFIKSCHARGIRVFLDVVMTFFAPDCPLSALALSWFATPYIPGGRNGYGQNLFLYDTPAYGGTYPARDFLCAMAEFWVTQYHVDGFRIDDFPDIANWEFVQQFRDRAAAANGSSFPGKPFLVIAENTNRQFVTTEPDGNNPNGRKVVDAIWNFGFQEEMRLLVTGSMNTQWGQPSRSERVRHLLSKDGTWNGYSHSFDRGYADLANAIDYVTSHDVANAPRMMNLILSTMLPALGLGDGAVGNVQGVIDNPQSDAEKAAVTTALHRVFGVFALSMTAVGIPMFLAGEEFGDIHDTDYNADNPKQQDPVQWDRAAYNGNAHLLARNSQLIALRTSHSALARNEIAFFYFHPTFDANDGAAVFAYARTGGLSLGSVGQVVVVANMSAQSYPAFDFDDWPWGATSLTEAGFVSGATVFNPASGVCTVALDAYQVRVFSC